MITPEHRKLLPAAHSQRTVLMTSRKEEDERDYRVMVIGTDYVWYNENHAVIEQNSRCKPRI